MNVFTDQFIDDFQKNFGEHPVFLRAWDYSNAHKFNPIQTEYADLDKFNDIKVWGLDARYSVFFHPNGDMWKVSSMKNRKNEDATTLYCLYADFDIGVKDKKNLKEYPRNNFIFTPTAVVETYNWFHVYWTLKEPVAVSVYWERWKKVMVDLAQFLWSDPKVNNLWRILRVPWFYYWSHKQWETDNPFLVECIDYNPTKKYSIEDFEKIFLATEKVAQEKYVPDMKLKEGKKWMSDTYNDIISRVPAIDVLCDLDSTYWLVSWNVITENGKETWWYRYWKNKNAIVDFTWKDRPQWTAFSVAKRYKGSDYETFKYFVERWGVWEIFHNEVKITAKEIKKQKEDDDEVGWMSLVPTIVDLEWKVDITVWTINITISFNDKKIYKMSWDEKSEIMDASIRTLGYYIDEEWINTYIVEYAKASWESGIIYLNRLGKKAELERRLSEVWISYFGWNWKVEKALVAYIHSCEKEMILINQLGLYDKKMIVNRSGKYTIDDEKWNKYFCNISDVQPSDRHSDEIFRIGESMDYEIFRQHISGLKNVYKDSIIYSLFTHYAMWMFAYTVRNMFAWLPSCSLVWTTSAWKTYARRLVMNMLGMDSCMEIKASTTEFSVLTLCKHNVPLSVWEYSNDELRFDWDPMLKNNYDWTANTRWTSNQKLKIYPNNACFCIDWEVWTMTNSVLTRQIALRFNTTFKKWLASDQQKENINGYFIEHFDKIYALKDKYEKVWRPKFAESFKHIDKAEKERILDNYALLMAFADCFEFADIVEGPIFEQCQTQFDLFWEDMIDKIIKQVFMLAVTSKIEVQILNRRIVVELIMDFMRLNKKRYDDLLSSVQSVNYHFMNLKQTDYSWSDKLDIPLDYVLKNKQLWSSFNTMLDSSVKLNLWLPGIEDDGPTILALRTYAKENWFTERPFYQSKLSEYKNVEYLSSSKPKVTR